ncbi:transposase [Dyella amyloliquefaciens]|uniref:transposase n=1 Tax=Dyella amyloliquefaciens TaxID=1770545 RepID=UPI00102ECD1D|nr:transposase [Dyella amyloliquefaciens]
MPRGLRLELPLHPLHVTQRGVNRGAVFVDDDDRQHYLMLLAESARDHELAVHAYVLMGNHVHLLVSTAQARGVSNAMRQIGQSYVPSFNRRHRRSGTLWEGRFKSCLVNTDQYLLTVYRYIELNPVRAGMVQAPEDHPWSSVHANLGRSADPLVTPHETFLTMAPDALQRAEAYRSWLRQGVSDDEIAAIRLHLKQGRALGDQRFQAMVEKTLGRPASVRSPGRPSRSQTSIV